MGSSLIAQLAQQSEKLKKERGLKLKVVGIASGHNAMFDREGISLENCREQLAHSAPSDLNRLRDEVIGMNIFNSVLSTVRPVPMWPGCIRNFWNITSPWWRPIRLRPLPITPLIRN